MASLCSTPPWSPKPWAAHVAPTPFLGSAVLAPLAILGCRLRRRSSSNGCRSWPAARALPGGAIAEPISGARDGAGVQAVGGGRLTGRALFAIDAAEADVILVVDGEGALCTGGRAMRRASVTRR